MNSVLDVRFAFAALLQPSYNSNRKPHGHVIILIVRDPQRFKTE